MSNVIQSLVDEGVFDQDPDGFLWLSAKMQDVITEFEQNEKSLALLKVIKNPEKRTLKYWNLLYLNFIGTSDKETTTNAVKALAAWERIASSRRLAEWSMKLRIS